MEYFIGIDPSFNSTGICIQKFDNNIKINEYFIILKPGLNTKDKSKWLTKKEKFAEEQIFKFQYWFYNKHDLTPYKELNHYSEFWKTYNMCICAKEIKNIIYEFTKDNPERINIVMEGISYGSAQRTKSIFDLAGLNYLIREKFINKENYFLTIVTPSEIKKFASGNGNCNKDIMIDLFIGSNPETIVIPKVDDIADSWFMCNYAYQIKKLSYI